MSCECCEWCDRDHDDEREQHCQQRQVSCYYALCYRGLLTQIFQSELRCVFQSLECSVGPSQDDVFAV